ncbi:MAG: DedA family protein [Dysgonomonas sp.]
MEFLDFIIQLLTETEATLAYLITTYGMWFYAILFLIIFCETGLVVTPFLPGDSMLFVAGVLIHSDQSGNFNIVILNLILIIAAVLGDATNYTIGRFFGEKLFSNPNSKIFKQSYLEKTHKFYEKHGGKTIIIARFVPIVRTFAPFVAGMGKMGYKHFAAFNVIGGIAWIMVFTLAGYFVGEIPWVRSNLKILIVIIVIVSILPGIFEIVRNKVSKKQD